MCIRDSYLSIYLSIYHATRRIYHALLSYISQVRGSRRYIYHQIILSYVLRGNSTAVYYPNFLMPHIDGVKYKLSIEVMFSVAD